MILFTHLDVVCAEIERLTVLEWEREWSGGRGRRKQQRGPRHERVAAAPTDGVARVPQLHVHVRLEVHATRLRHCHHRHEEAAQVYPTLPSLTLTILILHQYTINFLYI